MLEIDRSEWLASAFLSNTHRQGLHHTRVRQPCRKLGNLADSNLKCNTCSPIRSADAKHFEDIPPTPA